MTVQHPFASLIRQVMEEEKKNIVEEEIEFGEGEEGLPDGKRITGDFPWAKALLIAVIVVETALLVYTSIQRNTEGREISSARQKLVSMEQDLNDSASALEKLESDLESSKFRLKSIDDEKSKLLIEIQEKDVEKLKLQLHQQELERDNAEQFKKLRREKQISEYLRRKIVENKKNEFDLMKKFEELAGVKSELEEKLKMVEQDKQESTLQLEGIPLKEIVVTGEGEASPPLTGTILIANHEVKPPFVIINLGTADGISIGDSFTVKKKKKRVGSIIVSKLYRNMAVADIDRETTKKKLKKNWKVVSE